MDEVDWRDPPEPGPGPRGQSPWERRLAPLMEQEGRWAVVHKTATPIQANRAVAHLHRGKLRMPPGKWEFTSRMGEVFARYLGSE